MAPLRSFFVPTDHHQLLWSHPWIEPPNWGLEPSSWALEARASETKIWPILAFLWEALASREWKNRQCRSSDSDNIAFLCPEKYLLLVDRKICFLSWRKHFLRYQRNISILRPVKSEFCIQRNIQSCLHLEQQVLFILHKAGLCWNIFISLFFLFYILAQSQGVYKSLGRICAIFLTA